MDLFAAKAVKLVRKGQHGSAGEGGGQRVGTCPPWERRLAATKPDTGLSGRRPVALGATLPPNGTAEVWRRSHPSTQSHW